MSNLRRRFWRRAELWSTWRLYFMWCCSSLSSWSTKSNWRWSIVALVGDASNAIWRRISRKNRQTGWRLLQLLADCFVFCGWSWNCARMGHSNQKRFIQQRSFAKILTRRFSMLQKWRILWQAGTVNFNKLFELFLFLVVLISITLVMLWVVCLWHKCAVNLHCFVLAGKIQYWWVIQECYFH